LSGKKQLTNKMFFLSAGSVTFFIVIWALYFYLKLVPLGVETQHMFYREILPGLVIQGFIFALLFRFIYMRTVGKRFDVFLNYLNACVDGDFSNIREDELEGLDEISQAGQRVEVLTRFLKNLVGIVEEKAKHFKTMTLKLMSGVGQTEEGISEAIRGLSGCDGKAGNVKVLADQISTHFDEWANCLRQEQFIKLSDNLPQSMMYYANKGTDSATVIKDKHRLFSSLYNDMAVLIEELEEKTINYISRELDEEEVSKMCDILIVLRRQLGEGNELTEQIVHKSDDAVRLGQNTVKEFAEFYDLIVPILDDFKVMKGMPIEMGDELENLKQGLDQVTKWLKPLEKLSLRTNVQHLLQATTNLEGAVGQFGSNKMAI